MVIKIVIADDHTVFRQGTKKLLEHYDTVEIIADVDNGQDALDVTFDKLPDILLLDINMPNKSGLTVLSEGVSRGILTKIVMFTAYSDIQYVKAALNNGASGYLSKTIDADTLVNALIKIHQGECVVSEDISSKLATEVFQRNQMVENLTNREKEIVVLLAKGYSNQKISDELIIAVRTVETHVANILKKLNLKNRTQISSYAYEKKLL